MASASRRSPSELSEQIALADVLDRARPRLDWFHVPNGGYRNRQEAVMLRRSGVKAGVPDVVILTPALGAIRGAVVELKRKGGVPSDVRPDQIAWLDRFRAVGFVPVVAYGWKDAVRQLRGLGYLLPDVGGAS